MDSCYIEDQYGLSISHNHTESSYIAPIGSNVNTNFECVAYTDISIDFNVGCELNSLELKSTTIIFNFLDNEYSVPLEPVFNFTSNTTPITCGQYTLDGDNILFNHFIPSKSILNGHVDINHSCFGVCTNYIPAIGNLIELDISNEVYTPATSNELDLNIDCNLLPIKLPILENILSVEPFKFEVLYKAVFADCEPYRPEYGTDLVLNSSQEIYIRPEPYGTQIVLNRDCYTLTNFEFQVSAVTDSDIDLTLTKAPLAEFTAIASHGCLASASYDQINVNLSETCQRTISPLHVNVCQAGYVANYEHGLYAFADLAILEGINFSGAKLGFGQTLDTILTQYDQFFPELYETGQDVGITLTETAQFFPEFETGQELAELDFVLPPRAFIESDSYFGSESDAYLATFFQPLASVEYGSVLENTDIVLPPRAFIESDSYFGSFSILDALSTATTFKPNAEFGSDGNADLTAACITSIPLNTWRNGYFDSECSSVNRTANAKYYTFSLLNPKTVTIDLISSVDTFLYLLDGHGTGGTVLISNDDGGTGTNAKIVIALAAGDYTVESTTALSNKTGSFQVRVNRPTPDISDVDNYFGSDVETTLNTIPRFKPNAEFGSDVEVDLLDNPFDKLDVTFEFGSELSLNTIQATKSFFVNYGFGSDAEASVLSNPFKTFEANAEFGTDGNCHLSVTDVFDVDAHFGSIGSVYLLDNPFKTFEVTYDFGIDANIPTISRAATFNSYCFYGSNVEFDLQLALSEGVGVCNAYHGSELSLSEIATEAFTIFNQFGSTVEAELRTEQTINIITHFGSDVTADLTNKPFDVLEVVYDFGSDVGFELSTTTAFSVGFEHGFNSLFSIELPPRAEFELDIYHGQSAGIPETILNLQPIGYNVGLDFYVTHNHCESCCDNVDPVYNDSIIRVDQLDFDFSYDNFKDDYPWEPCDFYEVKFTSEFQTNPRFVIDFEVDSPAAFFYMPQEYLAFHYQVPDEILYTDTPHAIYKAELEVEFQHTTGAWLWGDEWGDETYYTRHSAQLQVELTETKYAEIYTGANAELNLDTFVPEWKTEAFTDMIHAAKLSVELSSVDYIRFCPGYILPNGNQVNFEFYGVESTNCNAEWIYFGETCDIELQANYGMQINPEWEAHLTATLTIELPWQVTFHLDEQLHVDLATTVRLNPYTMAGATLLPEMERRAYIAGHSTVKVFCDLAVPGPDIIWFTPADCLPNEYIAIDEFGDLDYSYYQPDDTKDFLEFEFEVVIENRQFKHALDARCFKPEDS